MRETNRTHKPHKHLLRIIAGIVFFILGILGLFLPILQGIFFLMISAGLLAPYVPFLRRLQLLLFKRYPALRHRIHAMKRRKKHKTASR